MQGGGGARVLKFVCLQTIPFAASSVAAYNQCINFVDEYSLL